MTDLDRLIEAVEGGPIDERTAIKAVGRGDLVWKAHHGSLDAALSLTKALLPGWEWVVGSNGDDSRAVVGGEGKEHAQADHRNPARALLLAVLKAYRETRG